MSSSSSSSRRLTTGSPFDNFHPLFFHSWIQVVMHLMVNSESVCSSMCLTPARGTIPSFTIPHYQQNMADMNQGWKGQGQGPRKSPFWAFSALEGPGPRAGNFCPALGPQYVIFSNCNSNFHSFGHVSLSSFFRHIPSEKNSQNGAKFANGEALRRIAHTQKSHSCTQSGFWQKSRKFGTGNYCKIRMFEIVKV